MVDQSFAVAESIRDGLLPYLPQLPEVTRPEAGGAEEAMATNIRLYDLAHRLSAHPEQAAGLEMEAVALVDAAQTTGPPTLIAQAHIIWSTLLLGLGRFAEADAAAAAGEAALYGDAGPPESVQGMAQLDYFLQLRCTRDFPARLR